MTASSQPDILISIVNLKKHFPLKSKSGVLQRDSMVVKAVDGVSFNICRGETLALVGESGCGKSTTGWTIVQLYQPTTGQVIFDGIDLTQMRGEALRQMRQRMQIIFQDPYSSLNPKLSVRSTISEPLYVHRRMRGAELQERVDELLNLVGINPTMAHRKPHAFSGGQRQRIAIARALAVEPQFIVCDEPLSSLDVSIQAQVVNLLEDLQERLGLTYLFISHDLSMVRHISDRVAVMYLGKIVELANRDEMYSNPLHPYTLSLISVMPPSPDDLMASRKRERIILKGEIPSPINPPPGCNFNTRCPWAMERCFVEEPPLRENAPGHWAACHLVSERMPLNPF